MRKLIVWNLISLDGYYEGPGGDVMVLPLDGSFDISSAERLSAADTLLLGRKTYDAFKSFWPPMADSETASPAHRQISRRQNDMDKMVVSDSLTPDETDPWRHNTTIVRRAEARQRIAELKSLPGNDILVAGSHTLWNDLLAHGLVDELHLMIGAVIIGDGTPAFESKPDVSLRLIEVSKSPGSENMLARYAVERTGVQPG
jgi:dihydrofolate reductase